MFVMKNSRNGFIVLHVFRLQSRKVQNVNLVLVACF